MLTGLCVLLVFQLVGEATTRGFLLSFPGPVLGMALLAAALALSARLRAATASTAEGLLRHLSLLFVPAMVGVVPQLAVIAQEAVPIVAALIGSTVLTIAVTALVFRAVARATGTDLAG